MDVKISGQWLEAVTLTRSPHEVLRAMERVFEKGYTVCVLAVDKVEIEGEEPHLLTVELD